MTLAVSVRRWAERGLTKLAAAPAPVRGPLTVEKTRSWLDREMATHEQSTLFSWRDEDPHPSEILNTRSLPGEPLGGLYRRMLADTDLAGYWGKLRDLALSLPLTIQPASPANKRSVETAEFCKRAVLDMPHFGEALEDLANGWMTSLEILETVYSQPTRGPLAGSLVPVALIDRPWSRFLFKKGQLYVRGKSRGSEVLAPPGKFVSARKGSRDTPWGGESLLDKCYWFWFLKQQGWKWFAVFIEKYAQPTVAAKYRHGRDDGANRENQHAALRLAQAFQSEFGVAIPDHLSLELIEATRSGDANYGGFLGKLQIGLANLIMGEINTSGLRPGVGAYASDAQAQKIRHEKVFRLAGWLCTVLREEVLRPLVEINFGPDWPVPCFCVEVGEAENRELRQAGMAAVLKLGEPVTKREFYMVHQVRIPQDGEEVLQLPVAPSEPTAAGPVAAPAAAERRQILHAADPNPAATGDPATGQLDSAAAALTGPLVAYWTRHQRAAAELFASGGLLAEGGFQALLDQAGVDQQTDLLHASLVHGMGLALRQLQMDGLVLEGQSGQPILTAGVLEDLAQILDPETAIDFWRRILSVQRSVFDAFGDLFRRLSFSVAGVQETSILVKIQELVTQAQRDGFGEAEFRSRLASLYEESGLTPTSDWHTRLILTNQIRQSHGAARFKNLVLNPAAHKSYPYLRFVNSGTDRVRYREQHNHQTPGGLVFAIGHPFWQTVWYPAGHHCECLVEPISRRSSEALGFTGDEPTGPWPVDPLTGSLWLPDPGFRSPANLGTVIDQVQDAAAGDLAEAKNNPGLLAALRKLLTRLFGRDPFGGV